MPSKKVLDLLKTPQLRAFLEGIWRCRDSSIQSFSTALGRPSSAGSPTTGAAPTQLEASPRWEGGRRCWGGWEVFLILFLKIFKRSVLTPTTWQRTNLKAWPNNTKIHCVGDLITEWTKWSGDHEKQLAITKIEYDKYSDSKYGNDARILRLGDVAATLLHSYGNALSGCPCQCRPGPFAEASLISKGLRGYFVQPTIEQPVRFLHPREALLLIGASQRVQLSNQTRDDLALIGLIASPMQSLWVCAHLKNAFLRTHELPGVVDPNVLLNKYQAQILLEAHHYGMAVKKAEVLLRWEGENQFTFKCIGAEPLAQNDKAMKSCQEWGHLLKSEGSSETQKESIVIQCEHKPKKSRKAQPEGKIKVNIRTVRRAIEIEIQAGQFIFEALRAARILWVNHVIDESGSIIAADTRLWASTTLIVDDQVEHHIEEAHDGPGSDVNIGCGPKYAENGVQTLGRCGLSELDLQPLAEAMFLEAGRTLQQFWNPRMIYYLHSTITANALQTIRDLKGDEQEAFGFYWEDNHWALFHAQWRPDGFYMQYYDGFYTQPSDDMSFFAEKVARATSTELLGVGYTRTINQNGGNHCGTIALLHLGQLLGLEVDATEQNAERWYNSLKHHEEGGNTPVSTTWCWTLSGSGPEDCTATLGKLLAEKGVPREKVDQRVREVQGALGNAVINNALRARNVWAALKDAANAPGIRFRLITHEEQEKYVQDRAKTKHGAQISSKKKASTSAKSSLTAMTLDPESLKIDPAHFQDSKGKSIQQIPFDAVEAGARGLAICSIQMAQPFLENPKKISQDALALLLTEAPPDEVSLKLGIVKMRYPAKYVGTQESIFVLGGILSLGDLEVSRKLEGPNPTPQIIKTAVLKIQMHKDQITMPWEEFIQAPLKHIIREVPALSLCDGQNCGSDCPRSHKAIDEEIEQIIMEVWSRTFHKAQGGKATPQAADIYQVFLRVPSSSLQDILEYTAAGCYMEPRQDGMPGAHSDYGVIWLPKMNYQAAQHACRTCPQALSLVRFRERYGVRILQRDEEKAWEQLRPKENYTQLRIAEIYEISPIPHGLTKTQVQELLQAWGWQAKPLSMGRGTKDYSVWRIGTATGPPSGVLRAFDKDILVNPIKQPELPKTPHFPIASWKTQSHLKQSTSASSTAADPWDNGHDPWAKYQSTTISKPQKDRSYLDTLSGNLKKEMTQHMQQEFEAWKQGDQTMEDPAINEKLATMEGTMMELQAQNQRMQGWFNEASTKIQGLEQQAQMQQQSLVQQHQAIMEVKQEVKAVAGETAGTLANALQSIKNELLTQIQADLGKIEAKMDKRPRHE